MLSERSKLLVFIFSILLLSGLKYVVDQSVQAIPRILQLIASVSLPIVSGLITLDFCSLLGPLVSSGSSPTSHLVRRISRAPVRNFLVGFLAAAYLDLIRPPLAANVPFLLYVEWVAIALVVYAMYSMTSFPTNDFDNNSENLGWKRHVQEIARETGSDFVHINYVMEQFVNNGIKEPLLVSLALYLQRIGQTEEEILKTLDSIINFKQYPRRQKTHLIFRLKKNELAMKNKKIREDVLDTLLNEIAGLQSK
jgi:hypothetical protein